MGFTSSGNILQFISFHHVNPPIQKQLQKNHALFLCMFLSFEVDANQERNNNIRDKRRHWCNIRLKKTPLTQLLKRYSVNYMAKENNVNVL